jgi:hypothetical protein
MRFRPDFIHDGQNPILPNFLNPAPDGFLRLLSYEVLDNFQFILRPNPCLSNVEPHPHPSIRSKAGDAATGVRFRSIATFNNVTDVHRFARVMTMNYRAQDISALAAL